MFLQRGEWEDLRGSGGARVVLAVWTATWLREGQEVKLRLHQPICVSCLTITSFLACHSYDGEVPFMIGRPRRRYAFSAPYLKHHVRQDEISWPRVTARHPQIEGKSRQAEMQDSGLLSPLAIFHVWLLMQVITLRPRAFQHTPIWTSLELSVTSCNDPAWAAPT